MVVIGLPVLSYLSQPLILRVVQPWHVGRQSHLLLSVNFQSRFWRVLPSLAEFRSLTKDAEHSVLASCINWQVRHVGSKSEFQVMPHRPHGQDCCVAPISIYEAQEIATHSSPDDDDVLPGLPLTDPTARNNVELRSLRSLVCWANLRSSQIRLNKVGVKIKGLHCSIMEENADSLLFLSASRRRSCSCHEGSAISSNKEERSAEFEHA